MWKSLGVLVTAGILLTGCGSSNVSDDMDVDEAIEYAYGLLEENKDSPAEDLYDNMTDDAIDDFMGELFGDGEEEITELPDGLNLQQLIKIQQEHYGLVKLSDTLSHGGDLSDDPIDYFVFGDYKITKDYFENTPISQLIVDLYNNGQWLKTGVNTFLTSDFDEDTVDLSDAEAVKKYIEDQVNEKGKLQDLIFHFVYYEAKNGHVDELHLDIHIDNFNENNPNNVISLNYTRCFMDDEEEKANWNYRCFSRKADGTYYLFASHDKIFQRRDWSKNDL